MKLLHIRLQPFTLCGVWLYEEGDRWKTEQACLPHKVHLALREGDFTLCEECRVNWEKHQEFARSLLEDGIHIPYPCPFH